MLDHHDDIIQQIKNTTEWDKVFSKGHVYRVISRRKRGKAADRFGIKNDFVKILVDDPKNYNLMYDEIFLLVAKGSIIHDSQDPNSYMGPGTCSLKSNNDIRPIQTPDLFRSITIPALGALGYNSKAATDFLETGNHGLIQTVVLRNEGFPRRDVCGLCRKYNVLWKQLSYATRVFQGGMCVDCVGNITYFGK
jgi:hypothetical protein